MTELERARRHLLDQQQGLAAARRRGYTDLAKYRQERVLAALSWVWDSQERQARDSRAQEMAADWFTLPPSLRTEKNLLEMVR